MNNDLISRSALLADLQEYLNQEVQEDMSFTDTGEGIDLAMERVKDAPAVDAGPVRHGRWDAFGVRRKDAKGRNRIEYMFNACTLCENPAVKRTAFCPNCGAKMDAEVHDDA